MWNPNQAHEEDDDDSWEARAFAEDTGNLMGITWPPRSYTCNFCRREFQSAQALGGHMNVHRRHRAQLRHLPEPISVSPISPALGSSCGGCCFFYKVSNPDGSACPHSPSAPARTHLGQPHLTFNNPCPELRGTSSSSSHGSQISSKGDESIISVDDGHEKLDLELRLGQRPSSSSLPE